MYKFIYFLTSVYFMGCATTGASMERLSPISRIKEMSRELTKQYSKTKSSFTAGPVAILSAYGSGDKQNEFGQVLSDTFTTELYKKGIKVVERQRIKSLITELDYQKSSTFNQEGTAKVGNVLGAAIIGIGVLKTIGEEISVSYRFLETKTGKVMAVADGKIDAKLVDEMFAESVNGVYRLKSVRVSVLPTKKNDLYWDPSSKTSIDLPDILVYLKIGKNDTIELSTDNTLDAIFEWKPNDQNALISYDERDPVKIWVYDKDLIFDDDIGEVTLEHGFPTDQVLGGQVFLGAFGRVKEVRISMEHVE